MKIRKLKYFEFSIGGYSYGYKKLVLRDFSYHCYFDRFELQNDISPPLHLSEEEMEKFIKGLNESDLLTWDKEYQNNLILDGTQWSVKMTYNGNLKKHIYGSNDCPKGFEKLIVACDYLIGESFFTDEEE